MDVISEHWFCWDLGEKMGHNLRNMFWNCFSSRRLEKSSKIQEILPNNVRGIANIIALSENRMITSVNQM